MMEEYRNRWVLWSLALAILLAGCAYPWANVPPCPEAGLAHYEVSLGEEATEDRLRQAVENLTTAGWSNISHRVEGVGGWGDGPVQHIVQADCPEAV